MADHFYLLIVHQLDHSHQVVELPLDDCDFPGWQPSVRGWRLGTDSSDATVRIDEESLANAELGVVPAPLSLRSSPWPCGPGCYLDAPVNRFHLFCGGDALDEEWLVSEARKAS